MFLKIILNSDLSNTSYRCYAELNDFAYIEYNSGYIADDWEEISYDEAYQLFPNWFEENLDSKEVQATNNELDAKLNSIEETQLTQLMALADIYETIVATE